MMDYAKTALDIRAGKPLDESTRNGVASLLEQCHRTRDRERPRITCRGAQANLDAQLRKLLPTDPVVYVDIGASEPIECSNTWQFYQAGGSGLLVEPMPFCWYPILLQRPRDYLYPKAISKVDGWARFHLCGTCSSLDPKWTTEKRGEIAVQTEPTQAILDKFPDVRDAATLCSIDTEGTEEDVIASADWEVFRPKVVIVEYKVYERPKASPFRAMKIIQMMPKYREVYRDEFNLVLERM